MGQWFHVKQHTMKTLRTCKICSSSKTKITKQCQDHLLSKETFYIRQCENCLFEWTDPQPEENNIGKYYKSVSYISHSDCRLNIMDWCYHKARTIAKLKKGNIIGKGNGKLLEIGSGTGSMLQHCQKLGWDVIGIETNKEARKIAKTKNKLDVKKSLEQANIMDNSVDTIMLWHVFEHLSSPKQLLKTLDRLLIEGGKLVIAVPNSRANEISIYKEKWAAYDVPRHLFHYNKDSMKRMVKEQGFEINKTIPLWFDAYYISILSERINKNRFSFIKGMVIGSWSNLKAWLYNAEFSSLVYVLTKKTTKESV